MTNVAHEYIPTVANDEVDFRRYKQGFNVIPANSVNKKTWIEWKNGPINFQVNPIPEDLHNEWKAENQFKDGYAIIVGKLWFGENAGKYGLVIDYDKWEAVEKWFGVWDNVIESANRTRIEWHQNKEKLHYFVYTKLQLENNNSIPGIEIRARNELVYCGKNKDGKYWTPLGTDKIATKDEIDLKSLQIMINGLSGGKGKSTTIERHSPNYKKHEGENRSLDLLQEMDSLLLRNHGLLSENKIKQLAKEWHEENQDIYSDEKFESNWNQALDYTSKILNGYTEEAEESRSFFKQEEESSKMRIGRGKNTSESWVLRLDERYEKLRSVVDSNLPGLWGPLKFALAVKSILNIRDCTLPFSGIILGPPSSLKSVAVELFRNWANRYVIYLDKFNPKSLVSHSANIKKEELKKVDLLPEIRNKVLLTPELAPMFFQREEDLTDSLTILTRVLDGHGWESHSGVHGKRGYTGVYMFTQLGAAVEVPYRVRKIFSQLGPRFYFLRLPKASKDEDYYFNNTMSGEFKDKIKPIETALIEYLAEFEMNPMIVEEEGLPKIPLNHEKDDERVIRYIVKLGMLLAPLRAFVPTWETSGTQGSTYSYEIAIIEDSSRAIQLLKNLAWGHALCNGRNYISEDDIPLLVQVVLSTTSLERAELFEALINNDGKLTTSEICKILVTTPPTALRTMTELNATGLVVMSEEEKYTDEYKTITKKIELDKRFEWFLGDIFKHFKHLWTKPHKENCGVCVSTNKNKMLIEEKTLSGSKHAHGVRFLNAFDYRDSSEESNSLSEYEGQVQEFTEKVDAISNSDTKKHDAYRSGGQWYCNNCNDRGDKFYMTEETSCRGSTKK